MKNTLHKSGLIYSGLILLGGSTLFFSPSAFSDTTVTYKQIAGPQKTSNTMQIKDGKIRFTPPNQGNSYSLYDSKTGALTHVDSSQKKYLSMDETAIAQQANQAKLQMDMMRQQMQDKMKDMPPEQRKQMEKMMNNHLARVEAQKNPAKLEQKKTSRTETIAGMQCTVHESFVNGIKSSEICLIAPDKMGLSSQDADTLMSMQQFMKRMQKVAQNMMGNNAQSADIQGIPLHTKLFAPDGSVKLETQLVSISSDAISAETMSVPADFSTMQMPAMPGAQ